MIKILVNLFQEFTVFDIANNGNIASNEIVFSHETPDTTAPTLTLSLTNEDADNNAYKITIVASEAIKNLSDKHITVSNGSVTTSVANQGSNTYVFTIAAVEDGNVTVSFLADTVFDTANNGNIASNEIVLSSIILSSQDNELLEVSIYPNPTR